jgi:hypothetical protein
MPAFLARERREKTRKESSAIAPEFPFTFSLPFARFAGASK